MKSLSPASKSEKRDSVIKAPPWPSLFVIHFHEWVQESYKYLSDALFFRKFCDFFFEKYKNIFKFKNFTIFSAVYLLNLKFELLSDCSCKSSFVLDSSQILFRLLRVEQRDSELRASRKRLRHLTKKLLRKRDRVFNRQTQRSLNIHF